MDANAVGESSPTSDETTPADVPLGIFPLSAALTSIFREVLGVRQPADVADDPLDS